MTSGFHRKPGDEMYGRNSSGMKDRKNLGGRREPKNNRRAKGAKERDDFLDRGGIITYSQKSVLRMCRPV